MSAVTTSDLTKGSGPSGHVPWSRHVLDAGERLGLIIVFAAMVIWFVVGPQGGVFVSKANIDNILASQAVVGVIALAMVAPLIAGYFDLSVAANAGIANVAIAAAMSKYDCPIALAVLIGLAISIGIGALNGFLIAKLKLDAFIVTFGVFVLLGGILTWYTNGLQIVENIPPSFGAWGGQAWLGVPRPFVALILVAAVVWVLLRQVPWGRYLEAIGSNQPAARLVGIDVDRSVWWTFVLSGAMAGVAGALLTSTLGGASPTAGPSFLFPAFAAVFLGATTISPGRYNVWGTVIGVFFVGAAVSGLSLLGASSWVAPVFNGASLIIAVSLSTFSGRARAAGEARAAATLSSGSAVSQSSSIEGENT